MQQESGIISKSKLLIAQDWDRYELTLRECVSSNNSLLNTMNNYVLGNMGKGIRPLLSLLTSKACLGEINSVSNTVAVATELIHNATLFHDDVVDNSDVRRGRKTIRSIFSPGSSVLLGDYWLSKAMNILVKAKCDFRIIELYSKTIQDLALGEMIQMERADDLKTTLEDYYSIISGKTASLFITSLQSAAIASEASEEVVSVMSKFALQLGFSFQVRDDILDYSPQSIIGKDADSDLYERKITPPLLGALKNAPKKSEEIITLLSKIDLLNENCEGNSKIVKTIKEFVIENGGIDYAKELLGSHIKNAVKVLSPLRDSNYKSALIELSESLNLK